MQKAAVIAAFSFFLVIHTPAAVASIDVSPVRVDLSESRDKGIVRIINNEDHAMSYEVGVVSWAQNDERKEVYSPTDDLLVVPPLFTLDPGEEQIVRVGMVAAPDPRMEKAYRMFITELARPQPDPTTSTGIDMRLQIGIPVFVAGQGLPTATLDYVDSMQFDEQLFLRFRNNGNMHVKVTEIHYEAPTMAEEIVTPASIYVLPGQTGYLPVNLRGGTPVGTVKVVTDTVGTLEYDLPIAP